MLSGVIEINSEPVSGSQYKENEMLLLFQIIDTKYTNI